LKEKGSDCEITLYFSHVTELPEDVMNGREYSFDAIKEFSTKLGI